ncbi:MAG TPA: MFS transporter [Halococcus sp.]|nr:MFS transporter [Halococcus sp.]
MNRYPPAVLATAFATFVAFLGIGVVDPILPVIGEQMGATPAEIELLFTSYLAIMAVAMLASGALSTRLGGKKTMLAGLAIVAIAAALCAAAPSVTFLAVVRGGWGFGNALFTATALSIIVGLMSGGSARAIRLYEAALGLGIATGPLLGGFLGSISWRLPFAGTAVLMAVAFVSTRMTVDDSETPDEHDASARDILAALKNRPVFLNALVGLAYSYGFFTILAYSPLTLEGLSAISLGITYFFWGGLVAIASVVIVSYLGRYFESTTILLADLVAMTGILLAAGFAEGSTLLIVIVASGLFCGIANAQFTTFAIEVSPFSRSVSSGAYNFLRWAGAAIAPVLAGIVGHTYGPHVPFFIAAVIMAVGALGLWTKSGTFSTAAATSSPAD